MARFILLAAVAISATVAASPPVEFLGFRMGEPLAIPECASEQIAPNLRGYKRDSQLAKPCFRKGSNPDSKIDPVFQPVFLVTDKLPPGVHYQQALIELVDGRVEGFNLGTVADQQQETMAALEERFGPPTSTKQEEVQNRMGAKFENTVATWETPGLRVEFVGLHRSTREGRLYARTPTGQAAADARAAERKAEQAKF